MKVCSSPESGSKPVVPPGKHEHLGPAKSSSSSSSSAAIACAQPHPVLDTAQPTRSKYQQKHFNVHSSKLEPLTVSCDVRSLHKLDSTLQKWNDWAISASRKLAISAPGLHVVADTQANFLPLLRLTAGELVDLMRKQSNLESLIVSCVVRSPRELANILKILEDAATDASCKVTIAQVNLEGSDFTLADIQTLPPSVCNLSAPYMTQLHAGELENLKRWLPKLESLSIGCTVDSRQELASTLKSWNNAAIAASCEVTIGRLTLGGRDVTDDTDLAFVTQLTRDLTKVMTALGLPAMSEAGARATLSESSVRRQHP